MVSTITIRGVILVKIKNVIPENASFQGYFTEVNFDTSERNQLSYFQNGYFSKILWWFHEPHNQENAGKKVWKVLNFLPLTFLILELWLFYPPSLEYEFPILCWAKNLSNFVSLPWKLEQSVTPRASCLPPLAARFFAPLAAIIVNTGQTSTINCRC